MGRVYNIGEFQVTQKTDYQGITYEGDKQCHHHKLTFDETGETIVCDDCHLQVTGWWAFLNLARQHKQVWDRVEAAQARLAKDEARTLTHKAAIAVEDAWRGRKMTPCCPHCHKPISAADRFGSSQVNKEMSRSVTLPMEFRGALELVEEP